MAATAEKPETKPAAKPDDAPGVAAILEDRTALVADLLKRVPPLVLGRAWAAGEVEFGHRTYVTVGKPGAKGSRLVVELGWTWSGPKKVTHKNFKDLMTEDKGAPACDEYFEYPAAPAEPVPESPDNKSPLRPITAAAAAEMLAWHVRLSDKGLASLEL